MAQRAGDQQSVKELKIIGNITMIRQKTRAGFSGSLKNMKGRTQYLHQTRYGNHPLFMIPKKMNRIAPMVMTIHFNYVGDKRLDVKPMMANVHFSKDALHFKIPVYLIQGEEDILTPKEITKKYFDQIRAPKKEYVLVPGAAHGFNESVLKTQFKIVKSISCP